MHSWYMKYGILVICALSGLAAHQWICWTEIQSQIWAAWVQAIGSIGAIIGAFYVGERQAKVALRSAFHLQDKAEKQRCEAIKAIAVAASAQVKEFANFAGGLEVNKLAFYLVYDERKISGLIGAISAVPVHTIGSAASVTAWLSLKVALINFQNAVNKYDQLLNGTAMLDMPTDGLGSSQLVKACASAVNYECVMFIRAMETV